jgi:hypothetical protein
MTGIAFSIDHDLADEINKRAAKAGRTSSDWISANLRHWLEGDDLAHEIGAALDRLSKGVANKARGQR